MNITEPTGFRLPGSKTKTNLENDTQRDGHAKQYMRIPGMGFLPNKFRNHFIAMVGEFIGTFLFLFFAFSATQVANASILGTGASTGDGSLSQAPNAQALMYIALAFGFSLAVNAWVFFRISGGTRSWILMLEQVFRGVLQTDDFSQACSIPLSPLVCF
jgi:aquaporin related protein